MESIPSVEISEKRKVIIVDDDESIRCLIAGFIGQSGFQVIDFDSGECALQVMKSEKIEFIILDVNMPVMDGFQFRRLQKLMRLNHIPVVVVTSEDLSREDVELLNPYAILQKNRGLLSNLKLVSNQLVRDSVYQYAPL